MKKRLLSAVLALVVLLSSLPAFALQASAATIDAEPYPWLEYAYCEDVKCGSIRYISQITSSSKFNWNYWPENSFGSYYSPGYECGTACLSMALSYIGVNKTPKDILTPYNGVTNWNKWSPAEWWCKESGIAAAISTAYNNYLNGNGSYSPLVVHLNYGASNDGSGDPGHYIILAGKVDDNTWKVVDPASSAVTNYDINGSSITYMGVANTIDEVHQWYNPEASIQEDHEQNSYGSYGALTVTSEKTYLKSLPCSEDTDANSQNVEIGYKGDVYTATRLILNDQSKYWYRVTSTTGETAYIYAGDVEFTQKSDLMLTGASYPTELVHEKVFYVTGIVASANQRINAVHVWVERTVDGSTATGSSVEVDVTRYDLSSPEIDYNVKFDELDVGKYNYCISARAISYYAKNGNELASTTTTYDLHRSTFSVVESTSCSHNYQAVVKPPTCTEDGYTIYTCTSCGYSYIGNTTEATGHSYGSWATKIPATCDADGSKTRTCAACGDMQAQSIPALGHSYTAKVIGATCVEYARTVYTCSTCGDSYVEYDDENMSEWSTTKPSGVDESLIESRTEYRYRTKEYTTGSESSLPGWTLYNTTTQWSEYGEWSGWSDTAVTASDTTKVETRTVWGYYYYLCSQCGAHMHGYGTCYSWAGGCGASGTNNNWNAVWSTTSWDNAGLKDWYGTGKYYTYLDGELVFKWSSGGSKTQYRHCTRELETVYQFYRWSDWSGWDTVQISENENTEVESRVVYRYPVSGLGEHSYTGKVTAPTCTAQGYTTHTCSVCGDSYVDSYTAALGHEMGSWTTVTNPTCTASGTQRRDCSRCDHYETQSIAATGHSYEEGSCVHCGAEDPNASGFEIASGWSGATEWTLSSDGVLRVYGSGNMKNYGYNRNQPWLVYADRIKSIVIEEGVTAIGTGAFMDLNKLESVTLPETGLKTIGEAAFYGCSSLCAVTIPEGIYTIWSYTFKNCTELREVNLPRTLIKIDQGAFENCTSLPYIYIPTNVEIIGSWSFKGCTGLVEADMTWADATKIREGAFKNCSALTTIHLPTNIQVFGDSCFYGIGATSFTVPATVTTVEPWCFARAYSLSAITFQGNAPTIGQGAFNKISLTAYYPSGNSTWVSSVRLNYGGTVLWKAQ